MSKTIAQQLNIKKFPFIIEDDEGNKTYSENSDGFWYRYEYDDNGNITYQENSNGFWYRHEYDDEGNETYHEYSNGFWCRYEYDDDGNETYYEDSSGYKRGTKKGTIKELSMNDIAKLVGIPVENLKIIK